MEVCDFCHKAEPKNQIRMEHGYNVKNFELHTFVHCGSAICEKNANGMATSTEMSMNKRYGGGVSIRRTKMR